MKRKTSLSRGSVTLLTAAALLVTGCTQNTSKPEPLPATSLSDSTVQQIDAAVSQAMGYANASEAVIGVWSAEGDYVSAFSTTNESSFDGAAAFRGAQTLQPILCAAVLQLWSEGDLDLDRELSRDIPRQTGIGDVTYRQACDGTSGLPDFKKRFNKIYLENPTRVWPAGQLISEALIQDPLKWPGLNVYRSDSAAVLLGNALSVRSGGDLNEFLTETIFKPANMNSTVIPARGDDTLPEKNSLTGIGYLPGPNCDAGLVDFAEVSVTILGTAGNTVTTVSDIKNFYTNLFAGTFGGSAAVEVLQDVKSTKNPKRDAEGNPTSEKESTSFRGFGVLKQGPLWGYDGALPGSATAAWHNPETGFTVVVALNNSAVGAGFATDLAKELAAITGAAGELPWTAETQAAKLAKKAVCQ